MLYETLKLNEKYIEKIAKREIYAVLVKRFITPSLAAELAEKIMSRGYEYYENATEIGRIGMAFYETERDPNKIASYFDKAAENIADLRERCSPLLCPIDLLRCTLDEIWPAGALLETLYGKKMFVGLSRVVEPNITFLAHHDIFSKDAPDCFKAHSLEAQIACNIYLKMPVDGGGLQMWETQLSPVEFDSMRQNSYGIPPANLGEPSLTIQPEPGDLILFNSQLMHAVEAGGSSPRLSLSCFVGYRGPSTPLSFWS